MDCRYAITPRDVRLPGFVLFFLGVAVYFLWPAPTVPLEDRPMGSKIHFSCIHYAEGKKYPKEISIWGTLNGPGMLSLNPNHIGLDRRGRIQITTLLGWSPIKVHIKESDLSDPMNLGRKAYEVIPNEKGLLRSYSIFLSPNEAGTHHLQIREGETILGTYPMFDPDREQHIEIGPKLAKATLEVREAIVQLRREIGYSFHFHMVADHAVSFFYTTEPVDLGAVNRAFAGLSKVPSISFNSGRLRKGDLSNLVKNTSLRQLHFYDFEIDEGGLDCLNGMTQLESLTLYDCRGITPTTFAPLESLDNLKTLNLQSGYSPSSVPCITDDCLKHLAGLNNLESLNIEGQPITDAGLKHFEGLANPYKLHISGTKLNRKFERD